MFTTYRADNQCQQFDSLEAAITWGRERESFEVRDADDIQVFQEFPPIVWA